VIRFNAGASRAKQSVKCDPGGIVVGNNGDAGFGGRCAELGRGSSGCPMECLFADGF